MVSAILIYSQVLKQVGKNNHVTTHNSAIDPVRELTTTGTKILDYLPDHIYRVALSSQFAGWNSPSAQRGKKVAMARERSETDGVPPRWRGHRARIYCDGDFRQTNGQLATQKN
jgi:hypothetical protein